MFTPVGLKESWNPTNITSDFWADPFELFDPSLTTRIHYLTVYKYGGYITPPCGGDGQGLKNKNIFKYIKWK